MRMAFMAVVALAVVGQASAFGGKKKPAEPKDIVETAAEARNFKTLVAAVKAAGLVDALKGKDPIIVLAPTDEAFAKLPKATLEALLKDKQALTSVLKYHLIADLKFLDVNKIKLDGVKPFDSIKTVQGSEISIDRTWSPFRIATLNNYVNIKGQLIRCTNGYIWTIDSVLMPKEQMADIVDTAAAFGQFKTLSASLEAAGLTETLKGKGPITLFAPTDDAFAKLPKGAVEALLKDKDALTSLLKYHVVGREVWFADILRLRGKSIETLQGSGIAVRYEEAMFPIPAGTFKESPESLPFATLFKLNGAVVLVKTVPCRNGVIHVIQDVLTPQARAKKDE